MKLVCNSFFLWPSIINHVDNEPTLIYTTTIFFFNTRMYKLSLKTSLKNRENSQTKTQEYHRKDFSKTKLTLLLWKEPNFKFWNHSPCGPRHNSRKQIYQPQAPQLRRTNFLRLHKSFHPECFLRCYCYSNMLLFMFKLHFPLGFKRKFW